MTPIPEEQLLAYFEGALPPDAARALAARLPGDPEAQALLKTWARQNAVLGALYAPVADEPVPDRLLAVTRSRPTRTGGAPPLLRIAAMLALLAVGGAGGWLAADLRPAAPRALADAAIAAHETYVVEVAHPIEVGADQATHLTGWVSKRLGHSIAPPDFAALGFRLMGGRVLPGDTGAAALFMYEDDQGRRVTLYVAPETGGAQTAFQFADQGGVQSFYWMDGALNYAVVGDIPRDALRRIALAAYDQLI
ncbi:anti-sigma factor family protein [Actibacterium sp. D379-3]